MAKLTEKDIIAELATSAVYGRLLVALVPLLKEKGIVTADHLDKIMHQIEGQFESDALARSDAKTNPEIAQDALYFASGLRNAFAKGKAGD